MKNLFRYFFSRMFLINAVIALGLIAALLYGVFAFLGAYTQHGQTITVPDFTGLRLDELDEYASSHQVQYVIVDSVYNTKKPKGTVVDQDPPGNFQVKQNRKIYLTVNATQPQMKAVPYLVDESLRAGVAKLQSLGFAVGDLEMKPNPECGGCIMGLKYKGELIDPYTMVVQGAKLDIVVGEGRGGALVEVPILLGRKLSETQDYLTEKSLNTGALVIDSTSCRTAADSMNAIVYRQLPMYGQDQVISLGGSFNLWCTCDPERIQSSVPDSVLTMMNSGAWMKNDSTAADSVAGDSVN